MKPFYCSEFKYQLDYTPAKKFQCVTVSFNHESRRYKRYLFIPKQNNVNCIEEAKKIMEREKENGELEKYIKKYNKKNYKKLLVILTIVFAAIAVASIGLLIYHFFFK